MDKTIDRWTDPDGNGYAFKDTVARAQNRATIDKMNTETADRKSELDIERKRIDNLIKELPATAGEYQQSKLVLHSYDNTAVKCTTTSGNYTNVPAFTTDQGGPLSSLYTKKSNYQIAVNKSGLYLFELRIHVNSLTANKRVELAPFVNDTRIAALASSYNTAGSFTLTQVAALPLWLSANDTVDFRIAPIDAAEVSLQLGDVLVYAIDWEDKFKIPDYTGYAAETKDIRTGADGTVYGTAGEAVRKQIGNLTEDIAKSDLAVDTITPNVLSATKYDGKEITSDVINEIYNHNGGTYDLTQKLKPTDKVIPRLWFDDGTYLPEISGLVLILQDDNNETVEQIIFGRENDNSLENATKAFLLNYNATSLTPFAGKVIKGITLEYKDFSDKYYGSKEKYSPTIDDLKKNVKLLDVVIPNILMNSEYNGEQFTQNVIDEMYNNTIDISLNEQIKGKIIPNILFNDGTNIGNVSGYVARIYSGSTLIEEVTLGNESAQDLSTATMIKFKTYRNDSASEYIGKNIFCFSATISDYAQKYKPYELESKRIQKLESELTVKNQIVCFGDSLTQGAGGNGISYPSVLKGLVGDNYSVINQGSGGENTIAILSRQGSVATYVNNIIIPANNKTAVKLCQPNEYLESNLGINSLLTIAGDMTGINPCCINGVIGNLLKVDDSNGTYYTFTRRNDGKEIVIDRPTRIFFYSTDKYNHSILCLFIGQNGGYSTEEELVEQIRNAIRHNGSDKYIILGLTTGSNTERASLEKTMQNAFGLHYLNTRKYLYMYGLSDANIKPTTQDEDDIKNGIVPTSLRSDSVHLNNKGYTVLGNIVYKKGVELGYW